MTDCGVVEPEVVSVENGEVVEVLMRAEADVVGVVVEGVAEDVFGDDVFGDDVFGEGVVGEDVVGEVEDVMGEFKDVVGEVSGDIEVGVVVVIGEALEVAEVAVGVSEVEGEVGAAKGAASVDSIVTDLLDAAAELGVGPKRMYP